jgi:hypothetical protein
MACCGDNIKPTAAHSRGIPSEPPCLECTEKHLGTAEVLLGEVFDGHPGHLKAIGNLRLAEEHSMQWPELHDAIRAARRGYQLRREMPNWAELERMILELHEKGAN